MSGTVREFRCVVDATAYWGGSMSRLTARFIVGLCALALLAGSTTGVAQAATEVKVDFGAPTRTVIDNAPAGSSVGDVIITTGDVLQKGTGKRIGYYTTNQTTVRADVNTRKEMRKVDLSIVLPRGTIFATALIRAAEGAPPTQNMNFAVVGGLGEYAGARGTLVHGPVAEQKTFPVTITLLG